MSGILQYGEDARMVRKGLEAALSASNHVRSQSSDLFIRVRYLVVRHVF